MKAILDRIALLSNLGQTQQRWYRVGVGGQGRSRFGEGVNFVSFEPRSYVWQYFQLHASQRLTTFNFYIVISSVIATGFFGSLDPTRATYLGVILGFLLAFLSFVFWRMDCRTKQMIWYAEEALKQLEALPEFEGLPAPAKIFTYEAAKTGEQRARRIFRVIRPHFSYSRCFNWVFVTFAALGIAGAAYSALRLAGR